MKGLIAALLAIVGAYLLVSFFWWLLMNIWWLTVSISKLMAMAIIALPLYIIIRKRLLRAS